MPGSAHSRLSVAWAALGVVIGFGWCGLGCDKGESEQLRALAEQHELGDDAALEAMARTLWGKGVQSASVDDSDAGRTVSLDVVYGDRPETSLDETTFTNATLGHLATSACKLIRFGHGRNLSTLRLTVLTRVGNRASPVALYRVRIAAKPIHAAVQRGCGEEAVARVRAAWHVELDRSGRLKMH